MGKARICIVEDASRSTEEIEKHLQSMDYIATPTAMTNESTISKKCQRTLENSIAPCFETSFDGIAVTENGKFVDVNDQFARTFGYQHDELFHKDVIDLVATEDKELVINKIRSGFEGPYEHRALHKDGSIVYVEVNGNEIQFQGRKARVTAIHDITERKISEQALQESEERLSLVLEVSNLGFFDRDITTGKVIRNQKAADIYGYSLEELENNREWWESRIHPHDKKRILKKVEDYFSGKSHGYETEYRIRHKSGEWRNIRSVGRIVRRDEQGHPLRFVGTLEDITDRIKTQELMVQTEKMMSVGGLAAGMAHEINNPLGAILQGTQNVVRRLSADLERNIESAEKFNINLDDLNKYLEERSIHTILNGTRKSAQKAARIIQNMLQYTRRSESHMAPNDIAQLLRQSVELARNDYDLKKKYDFRNIEIIEEFDPDVQSIICTETEIEQVILNLLKNSAHALANCQPPLDSPQIALRTKRESEMIRIEVEDNGLGMDEETRKRLFEPFFTTKPVGEGTGLGLSVSYMIITDNHQGMIEVDSEIGKGTRFIIRIPLEREHLEF